MTALVVVLSILAGVLAAVVVCNAFHTPIGVDVVLGMASLLLMLMAARLAEDISAPWLLLLAGLGYAVPVVVARVWAYCWGEVLSSLEV